MTPSLFNRLAGKRSAPEAELRERLELLLNSRPAAELPPDLDASLLGYGLPDFHDLDMADRGDRRRLCESIRRRIVLFEPRVTNVNVSPSAGLSRPLTVTIEAELLTGDSAQSSQPGEHGQECSWKAQVNPGAPIRLEGEQ